MIAATGIDVTLEREDFSLAVHAAFDERVVAIFGPSGSGKSTLFEVLLGFARGARGRVALAGEVVQDDSRGVFVPPWRRGLGWVPQDAMLIPNRSVREDLALGARRAGASAPGLVRRAIDVLGLEPLLDRRGSELSGGERQRVALARALASGPRMLLLDEPLASLDVPLRARVLPFLIRVRDELGLPMLLITHDPDEAIVIAHHVLVLDGGRVVAEGEPATTLWSRAVLPLSEALGLENVIEGRVASCVDGEAVVVTASGLELHVSGALAAGDAVRLGLRAQDVLLATTAPERISARNVFPAKVASCEFRDGSVFVGLDAGDRIVAKITPGAARSLELEKGRALHVIVKAQAFRRLA
ncbi:Maltose/maltodextrin import ATP-binding protein MalK [Myxococcaceae bacterium]|nr:Maltose/maltodextrin import ATP-binding protein MalK [Myxococcaceae bacterium]